MTPKLQMLVLVTGIVIEDQKIKLRLKVKYIESSLVLHVNTNTVNI